MSVHPSKNVKSRDTVMCQPVDSLSNWKLALLSLFTSALHLYYEWRHNWCCPVWGQRKCHDQYFCSWYRLWTNPVYHWNLNRGCDCDKHCVYSCRFMWGLADYWRTMSCRVTEDLSVQKYWFNGPGVRRSAVLCWSSLATILIRIIVKTTSIFQTLWSRMALRLFCDRKSHPSRWHLRDPTLFTI